MATDAASGAIVGGLTQIGLNQVLGPALDPRIPMTPSRVAILESKGYVTGLAASIARLFADGIDETLLRRFREKINPYILQRAE